MPKFNVDKSSLKEPIQFIFQGETYTVTEYTDEVLQKIREIDAQEWSSQKEQLKAQLAILTECDPETFDAMEIRVALGTIQWIMEQIVSPEIADGAKKKRGR